MTKTIKFEEELLPKIEDYDLIILLLKEESLKGGKYHKLHIDNIINKLNYQNVIIRKELRKEV